MNDQTPHNSRNTYIVRIMRNNLMQTSFFIIVCSSGDPDNAVALHLREQTRVTFLFVRSSKLEKAMKPQKIFTREQRKLLSIKEKQSCTDHHLVIKCSINDNRFCLFNQNSIHRHMGTMRMPLHLSNHRVMNQDTSFSRQAGEDNK